MVRPTKQDRDSVAITHVRISLKSKAMLDKLKVKGGYRTHDEALLNLLAKPQPTEQPLTVIDLLQRSDVNKLINATSKEIYHKYVSEIKAETKNYYSS